VSKANRRVRSGSSEVGILSALPLCGVITLPAFGRNGLVTVPPIRRKAGKTKTKTLSAGVCSLDRPRRVSDDRAAHKPAIGH
jgi:hypothetical protein